MREPLSRVGARLGNWNDRVNRPIGTWGPETQRERMWQRINRLAGWLYTLPDRGGDDAD